MTEEVPVEDCLLDSAINIPNALEAARIEYLDVDDTRTIVIYHTAILMVTATEGKATDARAFDVELWEPPTQARDRDRDDILTAFIDELLTATDASCR